ncbi:alpha/beta fold hydrolase [Thermodesulfobacteriota bacterium]
MSHTFQNIDQAPDKKTPAVFLPGWGFDGRVLRLLKPSPSWIFPENFLSPDTIEQDLLRLCSEKNISRIRIIGWSMGAMLGLEFAARNPEKVDSMVLVSLRHKWPQSEVKELQNDFSKAPASFLKNFYRKCFLGDRLSYQDFCTTLEPLYLNAAEMNAKRLERGLAFLEQFRIPTLEPDIPIRLIHGKQDIVAPIAEMATLDNAETEIIANSGHAVFLAEDCSLQKELRKQTIRKKFSRAADSYDNYAKVQTEVARKLAEKLPQPHETKEKIRILELGCGTGNFTSLLAAQYPDAQITALDFSPEMVAKAQHKLKDSTIECLCAEGEEYLENCADQSFDLIGSNGSLQWFADHDSSLGNIARILRPGGIFICSIFGPDSLKKLGLGLKTLFQYQGNVAANGFPDVKTLQHSLNTYFAAGKIEQELIEKQYASVHDLLVHINKTGTGGWHQHGAPALTPARLKQLDHWFRETYGRCTVTYQVHFLSAVK